MNARLILFSLIAGIALIFTSCDTDNNEGVIPLPSVTQAFQEKYPDARDVFFNVDGIYFVVDFKNNNVSTTAWFTDQGVWVMDKAYLPFQQLPTEVITAFKASNYSQWPVDDSYVINHIDSAVIYKIEVESGDNEVDLYYSVSGELLKVVEDDPNGDSPDNIPQEVTDL